MEINIKESRTLHYEKTTEYQIEIDGEEHTFRHYDSMDEELFWFDDEAYYDKEDEVMEGITIESLLDNVL
jgi:hypothetical protein